MKNASTYLLTGLTLFLLAGPLQADALIHVWECELEGD